VQRDALWHAYASSLKIDDVLLDSSVKTRGEAAEMLQGAPPTPFVNATPQFDAAEAALRELEDEVARETSGPRRTDRNESSPGPSRKDGSSEYARIRRLLSSWKAAHYSSANIPVEAALYGEPKGAEEEETPQPCDSPRMQFISYLYSHGKFSSIDAVPCAPSGAPSTGQSASSAAATTVEDSNEICIQHINGDLVNPERITEDGGRRVKHLRLIVIPVNNSGSWGSGSLFHSVRSEAPNAPQQYGAAKGCKDLRMGDAHIIPSAAEPSEKFFVLTVIQKQASRTHASGGDIDLRALDGSLRRVGAFLRRCRAHLGDGDDTGLICTVHFPRLEGISLEAAYALDKLLAKHFGGTGARCFVHYFSRRGASALGRRLAVKDEPSCSLPGGATETPPAQPTEETIDADQVLAPAGGPDIASCSFCLVGFSDEALYRAVARKILLHGGVLGAISDLLHGTCDNPVLIAPTKGSVNDDQEVLCLQAKGIPLVDLNWLRAATH
jgi:hypothetical protein